MIKKITATIFLLWLIPCTASPTYLGQDVFDKQFTVDGGKTITLRVGNNGALPVENDDFKITGAGFYVTPGKENAKDIKIVWSFSFAAKKVDSIISATVDQVTDSGELISVVDNEKAELHSRIWRYQSSPVALNREAAPWLYTNSVSTFIYKFKIKLNDNSIVTMYQPSVIPTKTKEAILYMLGN